MAAIARSDGLVNPSDPRDRTRIGPQSALQGPLIDLTAAGHDRLPSRRLCRRNLRMLWGAAIELLGQALAVDVGAETVEMHCGAGPSRDMAGAFGSARR